MRAARGAGARQRLTQALAGMATELLYVAALAAIAFAIAAAALRLR
jgi:hypothetical protein